MTTIEKYIKRYFDIIFSLLGLILFGWFIVILALLSKIIIGGSGFFHQTRVGEKGTLFTIYKIESIKKNKQSSSLLSFIRNSKLDELPQLWNILKGDMSFVGPRPDIIGFADELEDNYKLILSVKPGLTGPASLYYFNEERLLEGIENPDEYNRIVIYPKKIEMNLDYVKNYSLIKDINYLFKTIIYFFNNFRFL